MIPYGCILFQSVYSFILQYNWSFPLFLIFSQHGQCNQSAVDVPIFLHSDDLTINYSIYKNKVPSTKNKHWRTPNVLALMYVISKQGNSLTWANCCVPKFHKNILLSANVSGEKFLRSELSVTGSTELD
jgi:hypothetical protein